MGKQRRNRQACGKDGVSHRFLAALAAAATAAFLIAGPVAAMGAAWSGNPRPAQWHGHGHWGDQGGGSAGTQGDHGSAPSDQGAPRHGPGEHEQSGAGHRRGEHDGEQGTQAGQGEQGNQGSQGNQGNQGSSSAASSPVTTPDLPVTPTLPSMPIPSNVFPAAPAAPASPAAAATAASTAPRVATARNRLPAASAASAATGALAAPGLTAPPAVAPTPPGDLFPTPGAPKGGVLQTAKSYSLLLALAAAVVVFLAVQGRLGRRDPRITTPARDDLDFEDFE